MGAAGGLAGCAWRDSAAGAGAGAIVRECVQGSVRAGVCPGLPAGRRARPGWGRGGGGWGVRAGEGKGRGGREGSPGPAAWAGALPRHVRARSGADVFCLGERELSRRALPLAGTANLPSRARGGAAPDWRHKKPILSHSFPGGRAFVMHLPMDLEGAGPGVSCLAEGSVPFFSSFATGIKRQGKGGSRRGCRGERERLECGPRREIM